MTHDRIMQPTDDELDMAVAAQMDGALDPAEARGWLAARGLQERYVEALMTVTACREEQGIGWLWALVNAQPRQQLQAALLAVEN